jgi:hypothetical protein
VTHQTRSVLLAVAFVTFAFLAAWAVGGTVVTKFPTDAEVEECVASARLVVGEQPIECVQRTVISGTCEDVPRPPAIVDLVLEPNAPKYLGPWCAEDEKKADGTCPVPAGWHGVEVGEDGTAPHAFTFVGDLQEVDGVFQQSEVVQVGWRTCWAWGFSPVPAPSYVSERLETRPPYSPPLAVDAMSPEDLEEHKRVVLQVQAAWKVRHP